MDSERYHFNVGSMKCISFKDGGQIRSHKEFIKGVDEDELAETLRAEGIAPSDIDRVIITHADGDHVAGLIGADGRLAFPNAEITISEEAWEWWASDATLGRLPAERADGVRKMIATVSERVMTVATDAEILPGVSSIDA